VLEFENEGLKYELTREHRPRAGVTIPQTDIDYQQDCFLRKDGQVLGPDQRDSELARIMPETVRASSFSTVSCFSNTKSCFETKATWAATSKRRSKEYSVSPF